MKQDTAEESRPIESFSEIKQNELLQKLKKKIQKPNPNSQKSKTIQEQHYFEHSDIKILMLFVFFRLADDQEYETKNAKGVFKKIINTQKALQNKEIKLIRQKFYKKFLDSFSVVSAFKEKSNSFITNKTLIEKIINKLDDSDCIKLLRIVLNNNKINGSIIIKDKGEQIICSNKSTNYIVFLSVSEDKLEKKYLAIYSTADQIRSSIQQEATSSPVKSTEEQLEPEKNSMKKSKGKKSQSISSISENKNEKKQAVVEENSKKVSKSKSEGDKDLLQNIDSSVKEQGSYEVTWFETIVVLIIIFAILSEYFGIFDSFLNQFNQKIGKYYLLNTGYKVSRLLFKAGVTSGEEL